MSGRDQAPKSLLEIGIAQKKINNPFGAQKMLDGFFADCKDVKVLLGKYCNLQRVGTVLHGASLVYSSQVDVAQDGVANLAEGLAKSAKTRSKKNSEGSTSGAKASDNPEQEDKARKSRKSKKEQSKSQNEEDERIISNTNDNEEVVPLSDSETEDALIINKGEESPPPKNVIPCIDLTQMEINDESLDVTGISGQHDGNVRQLSNEQIDDDFMEISNEEGLGVETPDQDDSNILNVNQSIPEGNSIQDQVSVNIKPLRRSLRLMNLAARPILKRAIVGPSSDNGAKRTRVGEIGEDRNEQGSPIEVEELNRTSSSSDSRFGCSTTMCPLNDSACGEEMLELVDMDPEMNEMRCFRIKVEPRDDWMASANLKLKDVIISPEDTEALNKELLDLYTSLRDVETSSSERLSVARRAFKLYNKTFLKHGVKLQFQLIPEKLVPQPLPKTPHLHSAYSQGDNVLTELIQQYRQRCDKILQLNAQEFTEKSKNLNGKEFKLMRFEFCKNVTKLYKQFSIEADNHPAIRERYRTTTRKLKAAIDLQTSKEEFDVQKYSRIIIVVLDKLAGLSRPNNLLKTTKEYPSSPNYSQSESGYGDSLPYDTPNRTDDVFDDSFPELNDDSMSNKSMDRNHFRNNRSKPDDSWAECSPLTEVFHARSVVSTEGEVARNFCAMLQMLSTGKLKTNCYEGYEFAYKPCPSTDKDEILIGIGEKHDPIKTVIVNKAVCNLGDHSVDLNPEKDIHQKLSEFREERCTAYSGKLTGKRRCKGSDR